MDRVADPNIAVHGQCVLRFARLRDPFDVGGDRVALEGFVCVHMGVTAENLAPGAQSLAQRPGKRRGNLPGELPLSPR